MPTRNEAIRAMLDLPSADFLDALSTLIEGSGESVKTELRALLGPPPAIRMVGCRAHGLSSTATTDDEALSILALHRARHGGSRCGRIMSTDGA